MGGERIDAHGLHTALWGATVDLHPDGPGAAWLASRGVARPGAVVFASVRWLHGDTVCREDHHGWGGTPAGASGALVFAWRRRLSLAAVLLVAVSETAQRVFWPGELRTLSVGEHGGAVFEACPGKPGARVHVASRVSDALSLSLAYGPNDRAVALGGVSGMRNAGAALGAADAIVHAAVSRASRAARDAAFEGARSLRRAGGSAQIQFHSIPLGAECTGQRERAI